VRGVDQQPEVVGSAGNVVLPTAATGLRKESVANVSQIVTIDEAELSERVGNLPRAKLELVLPESTSSSAARRRSIFRRRRIGCVERLIGRGPLRRCAKA
jgi:hypothetical protein